ncbi:LLM class flavin-dependent oxidoreductase [Propionibacterium australiense]|uniref:Luciferase-like domain n=1 Tax=Propionibacterium australiense TaxID=119981 RepID=A0A383S8R5_9ACTN|nr:LLM class flavin-dependent oxidoreductase [Propionibacterium australiense]SYZ34213.1 Luciferase-like domain [Propionibacterium australiense]VEH89484.1 luciferase family oxidoreductase, group 1 [Propionibacterium australiense]
MPAPTDGAGAQAQGRSDTRLSALDRLPLFLGRTEAGTLHDAARLARGVEELGFERFWVAEHHNAPYFLSSAPDTVMTQSAGPDLAHPGRQRPHIFLARDGAPIVGT